MLHLFTLHSQLNTWVYLFLKLILYRISFLIILDNGMEILIFSFTQLNNVFNLFLVMYLSIFHASIHECTDIIDGNYALNPITCHGWAAFSCVLWPVCLNNMHPIQLIKSSSRANSVSWFCWLFFRRERLLQWTGKMRTPILKTNRWKCQIFQPDFSRCYALYHPVNATSAFKD